ncbi:MAG: hypothetical protein K2P68_06745 [Sphingomonas sp.]|nr:hypothetical protein [Sphingomonas sp.]MBY0582602.1 hypothetical protein [Sphingomonas sp.]
MIAWLDSAFSPRTTGSTQSFSRQLRLAVGLIWLALTLYLVSHHVMWRDEVRALSLALSGDTIFDMPSYARGYGHPLLWHVILRTSHDLFGTRLVLPGAALVVTVAANATLLWASPLRLSVVCLVMFSFFGLYEYCVTARNYGISMLLLFAIAASYTKSRHRGPVLGLLLALLCNTNVHSVVLALAFYLFWAIDLIFEQGIRWSPAKKNLILNAAIVAVGVVASIASVVPSLEDAPSVAPSSWLSRALEMIPGTAYARIFGNFHFSPLMQIAAAILVFGSTAMFARRPAALIAALAALVGLQAIFVFVYPGFYRHEALVIVFDITLLWLVVQGHGGRWQPSGRAPPWLQLAEFGGRALFLALLASQLPASARAVVNAVNGKPESETQHVAELIARHGLQRAIIVTDPDFMAEALAYYLDNPIYSLRQRRFSHVVGMRLAESRPMTLARILTTAQMLQNTTSRDVLVLLNTPLPSDNRYMVIDRSTFGPLVLTPGDLRAFRDAVVPLGELRQASGDEDFSVYLLNRHLRSRATPKAPKRVPGTAMQPSRPRPSPAKERMETIGRGRGDRDEVPA